MLETVYPARTWCTFDAERDELTVVQDGVDGISVVTMPAEAALADQITEDEAPLAIDAPKSGRMHLMTSRYRNTLVAATFAAGALFGAGTVAAVNVALTADVRPVAAVADPSDPSDPNYVDPTSPFNARYLVREDGDPVAECLLNAGYVGDANDGVEAIYAPREDIVWCSAVSA